MNQMMGSSSTALSDLLGRMVNISTPESFEMDDLEKVKLEHFPVTQGPVVVISFHLTIEGVLDSEFMNIMSVELAKELVAGFGLELDESDTPEPAPAPAPMPASAPVPEMQPMPQMQSVPQMMPVYQQSAQDPMMLQLITQMQQSQMQMMEMINEMKRGGGAARREAPSEPSIIRPLESAAFEGDGEGGDGEDRVNQEMLLKVPLEVSVEIGRAKKLVGDILEFTQGSLVVLDKMAGEQADLYVNGQCIARGDVVVVEDNFGIRITEIVTRNLNPETL